MMGAKARESKTEQRKQAEHKSFAGYIVKADPAQGIIDAVVNVFGIVDLGDDVIHNGAYTKTLNERGNQVRVRVLDNHNTDSILRVIGKPIEIREIGRDELALIAPDVLRKHPTATGGLFTRTQFLMDTPEGEGAYKRLASGAVDEWSIALDALDVDFGKVMIEGKERVVRNLRQIRLYEYSPVIWGMNQATTTTDVKNTDAPDDAKQGTMGARLEACLRNEFGYRVNGWFADGILTGDDLDTLNGVLRETMIALRTALPAAVTDMVVTYYAHELQSEQKGAALGVKLEASLRREFNWCVTCWLNDGIIDIAAADALDDALKAALVVFRTALPPALAALPVREYYAAPAEQETKAGRMISGANREHIQAAIDALQALMDASAPADPSQDETTQEANEKARRGDPQSPTTGPEAQGSALPSPSIVDAASIEHEIAEVQVLMEMIG